MLPPVMPKNRFGRPSLVKSRAECQSGCAMMPTRKPWASSTRPTIAMPKLGWSTYASPVTMMTSQESQPSSSISAREWAGTGRTEPMGPEFSVAEEIAGGLHGMRHESAMREAPDALNRAPPDLSRSSGRGHHASV